MEIPLNGSLKKVKRNTIYFLIIRLFFKLKFAEKLVWENVHFNIPKENSVLKNKYRKKFISGIFIFSGL